MHIQTEFRGILGIFTAKNTAFRMFFKKFRIPSEVKKRTSVDTLNVRSVAYLVTVPPHLFPEFLCLIAMKLHESYCRFRNASGLSVHVRNVHDMQRNMRALFHMVKVKKHIQVCFQETVPLLKVFQIQISIQFNWVRGSASGSIKAKWISEEKNIKSFCFEEIRSDPDREYVYFYLYLC
jgi:hypothetical protein